MIRIIKYFFVLVALSAIGSCKDDDESVGLLVQPEEDVLQTYSNKVDVSSTSILSDSVLSRYDYFLLGRYRDTKFGETTAEYVSQLDGRIGGINIPDVKVVESNSAMSGILNTLLTDIDPLYGNILAISEPKDVVVDSTVFYISYSDYFFGDSLALQALSVYELTGDLKDQKYLTNAQLSDFCDKSKKLGQVSYQIQNKRKIIVPLDNEVGERLVKAYQEGISSQDEFNKIFKGVYVSHSFNQGTVMMVTVSGVQVYYHYDAKIATTYNGRDTVVMGSNVKTSDGTLVNPLVSSFFLSTNKSVKRVNMIRQDNLEDMLPTLNTSDYSYAYTPAGFYTSVSIPFNTVVDSIKNYAQDTSKVMFNSAKLIFHRRELDWKSSLKTNAYLMLIEKSKVIDFFYKNEQPDGLSSFVAKIDTARNTYTFNITAPLQNKLRGNSRTFGDDLVLVPVALTVENGVYFYRQQLWLTATQLFSSAAQVDSLRPRLDLVYTVRR
ncbi:MAG: DUF4270 domain-containing protein [Paludibacteraceae bacterium]|nr:DUF4270 domain-containing protein [Paludibacteraceae bacterium]